ncbi:hypothetical protein Sarmat_00440 [Rickettsiales endosymbiont of Paramecium tredecaurelia]|nr:hypothetical protein [Candidatus Sarmatiella mevalonica]
MPAIVFAVIIGALPKTCAALPVLSVIIKDPLRVVAFLTTFRSRSPFPSIAFRANDDSAAITTDGTAPWAPVITNSLILRPWRLSSFAL